MEKNRNYHFDNVKALLIFLVVFGHLIEPLRDIRIFSTAYFVIYSFHMPLFVFISGYFSKPSTKGLKRISLLFLKYEIIYALIYVVLFGGSSASSGGTILDTLAYALQPIWVLWFLLSLISWKLLLIAYEKHPIAIGIIIGLIIGFNFIPFNFRILSLGRTLSFFPYFLLGYLANKHKFDFSRLGQSKTISFYLIALLILFWQLYSTKATSELLYGTNSLVDQSYSFLALALFKFNSYLVAIASSIIILRIVPKTENSFTHIGVQTMPIFILHGIFILFLTRINFFERLQSFSSIISFIILLVLSVLLTLFLKDRKV